MESDSCRSHGRPKDECHCEETGSRTESEKEQEARILADLVERECVACCQFRQRQEEADHHDVVEHRSKGRNRK
jgi:hypothetical protein